MQALQFTGEEWTVPAHLDGWKITEVFFATNTASSGAYQMNLSTEPVGGGGLNFSNATMLSNETFTEQTLTVSNVVNKGDRLKIFIGVVLGSMPNGLEVTFKFEK